MTPVFSYDCFSYDYILSFVIQNNKLFRHGKLAGMRTYKRNEFSVTKCGITRVKLNKSEGHSHNYISWPMESLKAKYGLINALYLCLGDDFDFFSLFCFSNPSLSESEWSLFFLFLLSTRGSGGGLEGWEESCEVIDLEENLITNTVLGSISEIGARIQDPVPPS